MKIACFSDTHYNFRKNSKLFHDYFKTFYDDVFFPTLDQQGIKTVVHMGDVFDTRQGIDYAALAWAKDNVFNQFQNRNIYLHLIVGNHDSYYKNTNHINSLDLLLREYDNVTVYSDPTEVRFGNLGVLMVPWINIESEEHTMNMISQTDCPVVMGHLELNGFVPHKGHVMNEGRDPSPFNKFQKVFSGHYHTRSDNGKIFYIGNPYEMIFSDMNDDRGFIIFDTDTLDHEYINNPHRMHYSIYYEDNPHSQLNTSLYDNKILRLIIRKKNNIGNFDAYLAKLYSSNIAEIKIIESGIDDYSEFDESLESEDTMTLLQKFIDDGSVSLNKDILKNIINEIHREAMELI
jgi:DNA repair exonuclease SbcCD nuclease subunit